MNRRVWVVLCFALLVALLAAGLTLDPTRVPSPLIGRPMPSFDAASVRDPARVVSEARFSGPALVNVWASWCAACRDEHALLLALAADRRVPVYGVNYKDRREDAVAWLERLGDPYVFSVFDESGSIGLDWGVYGVPETFVIDGAGVIRHKHIGPLDAAVAAEVLLPMLAKLGLHEDADEAAFALPANAAIR